MRHAQRRLGRTSHHHREVEEACRRSRARVCADVTRALLLAVDVGLSLLIGRALGD